MEAGTQLFWRLSMGAEGKRGGTFSHLWRLQTGEEPITTYAPDDNEWFAEIFRLFITNPSLCAVLRPSTYVHLKSEWPNAVETRSWEEVLEGQPRLINAANNKIKKLEKLKSKEMKFSFG